MAETYHVLNWRELPLRTAAVLASGLHQDSRCFRKIRGQKLRSEEYAMFAVLDEIRMFYWSWAKMHGAKKSDKPESVLMKMLGLDEKTHVTGFRTVEEFEARRKIIAGE